MIANSNASDSRELHHADQMLLDAQFHLHLSLSCAPPVFFREGIRNRHGRPIHFPCGSVEDVGKDGPTH
ncbi:hypothetical protein ACTMU2_40840 [Cupriavidus basilensis]